MNNLVTLNCRTAKRSAGLVRDYKKSCMNLHWRRGAHIQENCRLKQTASSRKDQSRVISRALKAQGNTNGGGSSSEYIFGLRPVDFTKVPPLYRPPPPPPPKPGFQRYIFPFSVITLFGVSGFFYLNNKNDAYEYWEAMQTGGVIPGTYDDDDDDDDDDDFDDE